MALMRGMVVMSNISEKTHEISKDRYFIEKIGFFKHAVLCGNGTRHLFVGSKKQCRLVSSELKAAFYDGAYVEANNK